MDESGEQHFLDASVGRERERARARERGRISVCLVGVEATMPLSKVVD